MTIAEHNRIQQEISRIAFSNLPQGEKNRRIKVLEKKLEKFF